MKTKPLSPISLIAVAAMLVACGGGGDGGGSGGVAASGGATTSASVALITSPTPPGSGVDAEELAAFNALNAQRSACGFGQLNWNTSLATAALGHADWQIKNNYISHNQIAGTLGFTGVNFSDRFIAAGLSNFVGTDEIAGFSGSNSKTGQGSRLVRELLSAPYHAFGLLGSYTDVGFAVRNATDAASTYGDRVLLQANLLYQSATGPQLPSSPAASAVRTYPCQGTTGTRFSLTGEEPNPVQGRDLSVNPIGHPVLIEAVNASSLLVISSASIAPQSGLAVTLLSTLTQSTDTNNIIRSNQAVLMPNAPLTANTTYNVSVTGTVDGTPFSSNFSWTTGS